MSPRDLNLSVAQRQKLEQRLLKAVMSPKGGRPTAVARPLLEGILWVLKLLQQTGVELIFPHRKDHKKPVLWFVKGSRR